MKRFYVALFAGALLIAGCKGEVGTPVVTAKAVNNGADLDLSWGAVENASTYKIYGDDSLIAEIDSTHFVLKGSDGVFKTVTVEAVGGGKAPIDLTPYEKDLGTIYTHDDPDSTHHSWVKVYLKGDSTEATTTNQAGVDPTLDNTAYFVFYNNSGTLQFKDISKTSLGSGKVHTYFADPGSVMGLAPNSSDSYGDMKDVSGNSEYYLWFDRDLDGDISTNSCFGLVKVGPTNGTGPYNTTVTIYVQNKVSGLGWIKY